MLMIWVDFTILVILAVAVIIGLLRGYTKTVYSLGFWLLAIVVGLNFSKEFSLFLVGRIDSIPARMAAAFACLLLITLFLGACISLLLGEKINKPEIGILERLGGMIFGFGHGLLIVLLLVIMSGLGQLPKESWWQESKLLPVFQQVAVLLRNNISSGTTGYLNYQ